MLWTILFGCNRLSQIIFLILHPKLSNMGFEYMDFLKQVAESVAPSGNEKEVLDIWSNNISGYVSDIYRTPINNTVAVKYGTCTNKKKIMLAAHADEIGLIITYIDNDGFLYFDEIGGIDTNLLPGRIVAIRGLNGIVKGIIGAKPIHLQERSNTETCFSPKNLWIDIHVKNKEEALKFVQIGCVATLISEFSVSGSRYIGKAMDNRCSMAVLLSVAECLHNVNVDNDVYFVATVQEEIRARGAQTVAFDINPDICIVIDVTHATDYPSMSLVKDGDIRLGKGVVIALGPNMDSSISQKLILTACDKNINYQLEAFAKPTGTDANTIQITKNGIPVGLVSIPCRYMHSPVEIIDEEDLKMSAKLLTEFILALNE